MKGLALSRAYFFEAIRPILAKRVTEIGQSYAAALLGWGSDVLGNDDELSRDHEWGPRCLLFLPEPLIRHRGKNPQRTESSPAVRIQGASDPVRN